MRNIEYKIKIESPCKKIDWNKMSDFEKGKICTVCSKKVYDLTNSSDRQIDKVLNDNTAPICAKLSFSQMNRVLNLPRKNQFKYYKNIAVALTLLGISNNSYSSNYKEKQESYPHNILNKYIVKENDKKFLTTNQDTTKNVIAGKIISTNNDIAFGRRIFIKDTDIEVYSDSLGIFKILLPKDFKLKEFELIISSIGFEDDTTLKLKLAELPVLDLNLKLEPVAIGSVIIERKRWWQFWKRNR